MCFYEQSMRLSCRFLQIKEVNQKFPQMTFIRLKLDIFARKKIYDADTKSLIFQGYVVTRCPILRYDVWQQTILTTTYWWHHLLSNGGNLFILLCIKKPPHWSIKQQHGVKILKLTNMTMFWINMKSFILRGIDFIGRGGRRRLVRHVHRNISLAVSNSRTYFYLNLNLWNTTPIKVSPSDDSRNH